MIVNFLKVCQYGLYDLCFEAIRKFGSEGRIEEISNRFARLLRKDKILAALFTPDAHAQRKHLQHIFFIAKITFLLFRAVSVRPFLEKAVHFLRGKIGKHHFGYIVQFDNVEQRAAFAHFPDRILKLVQRLVGKLQHPFFEVGI